MSENDDREYIENICKKLRMTKMEYPNDFDFSMPIIGSVDGLEQIGGHKHIYAPTLSAEIIGGCKHKVSRYFEDI